jgi:hypothetical protein
MKEPQEFFIAESMRLARSLPLPDAIRFLNGFCVSCSDAPRLSHVRKILIALSESDKQLERMATGEINRPLN